MTIKKIIEKASRTGRIKDGLVLCENCETPASRSLSLSLSWTCCAPCALGEADSFDPKDLISVEGGAQSEPGKTDVPRPHEATTGGAGPTPNYCAHDRLNEDGICRACGADCRGIG